MIPETSLCSNCKYAKKHERTIFFVGECKLYNFLNREGNKKLGLDFNKNGLPKKCPLTKKQKENLHIKK